MLFHKVVVYSLWFQTQTRFSSQISSGAFQPKASGRFWLRPNPPGVWFFFMTGQKTSCHWTPPPPSLTVWGWAAPHRLMCRLQSGQNSGCYFSPTNIIRARWAASCSCWKPDGWPPLSWFWGLKHATRERQSTRQFGSVTKTSPGGWRELGGLNRHIMTCCCCWDRGAQILSGTRRRRMLTQQLEPKLKFTQQLN